MILIRFITSSWEARGAGVLLGPTSRVSSGSASAGSVGRRETGHDTGLEEEAGGQESIGLARRRADDVVVHGEAGDPPQDENLVPLESDLAVELALAVGGAFAQVGDTPDVDSSGLRPLTATRSSRGASATARARRACSIVEKLSVNRPVLTMLSRVWCLREQPRLRSGPPKPAIWIQLLGATSSSPSAERVSA